MPIKECLRCGTQWEINSKRIPKSDYCFSCRATKITTIRSARGVCLPWHGLFAPDLVTPVDEEGNPILPGIRECGNLDCVQPGHIKKEKENG